MSAENAGVLSRLIDEFQHGDTVRRHGLSVRSKILLCGPPGCGKSLTAEVLAKELALPFYVAKLDGLVSSFLGETASNVRKIFDLSNSQPCVLFLDEFDALARARSDTSEHNELRRVVNSLLMLIDRFKSRGFLLAATNLEESIDSAMWRRFDEVMLLSLPHDKDIKRYVEFKLRNIGKKFSVASKMRNLRGLSYSDIERICTNAIKHSILAGNKEVLGSAFDFAIREERRRLRIRARVSPRRLKK